MGIEIERKFLVSGDFKTGTPKLYRQGYLSRVPERTVRIRVVDQHAWITIKSLTDAASRQEFEYPIPVSDGIELLALCDGPLIEKYRWLVEYKGMLWEVDEFLGDNAGLVVAEIELEAADQEFALPPWIAEEVTSDYRYHNSRLAEHPYSTWKK